MSQNPWLSHTLILASLVLLLGVLVLIPGNVEAENGTSQNDKLPAEPAPTAEVSPAVALPPEFSRDDASMERCGLSLEDEGRRSLAGYIYCGDPCGQEGTFGACVVLEGGYPLYVLCECSQGTWSCAGGED